jgi:hypothetical protein
MSENIQIVGNPPAHIPSDPLSRSFPPGWKDIWFRTRGNREIDGVWRYTCPICNKKFDHAFIDHLQGDHIWPYSLFGETSWENFQLICGNCNAGKSNFVHTEIRKALGSGMFRNRVATFLKQMNVLGHSSILENILKKADDPRQSGVD